MGIYFLLPELTLLAVRLLVPLHPILAAIQSIGVIRRDVEGDKSIGLGRIISYSFLIHGVFDFILILQSGMDSMHFVENILDDDVNEKEYEEKFQEERDNLLESILMDWQAYLACFLIVVGSVVFYIHQAHLQKVRISNLESTVHGREMSPIII